MGGDVPRLGPGDGDDSLQFQALCGRRFLAEDKLGQALGQGDYFILLKVA